MAKTPLFTVFRASHVFLKLKKHCKYHHFLWSDRNKCCNLDLFALLAKIVVFAVFCASRGKNIIGIYSIFCIFALFPQETWRPKNVVIYNICCLRKAKKNVRKMCQNGVFLRFWVLPSKRRGWGNALGDAYERPKFGPKSYPPATWRIFVVFRGPASQGRRLGARLTIEL